MTNNDTMLDPSTMPAVFRAGDGLVMLASGLVAAGAVVAAAHGVGQVGEELSSPMLLALIAAGFVAGVQFPLLARLVLMVRRARADTCRLAAKLRAERAMFHDLQHQVANATQFAGSLLSLAASRVRDRDDAQAALEDAAARLAAMAAIHRRLHDPALADRRLGETLAALARDLLAVQGRQDIALSATVTEDLPTLGLGHISAIASIVVEAVTNAVKHAFVDREGGRLEISLHRGAGTLLLAIVDDGPGPRAEAPDPTSLGLAVMEAMAARLGGRFMLERAAGGGAAVRVVFPAP
ncbi:sensor histidine kinase [Elioraea sp.]|uniref:ATP-binding protein n=1 Tax=Elioraea sp. TaxID=2185103 RepID=UPI0025BFFE94|nr:sensor histidine kinase [Elioraea sp.]